MATDISKISLLGRMAYVVMCVEAYLMHVYPALDWRPLAKVLWSFPHCFISNWMFCYDELTPAVALHGGHYNWNVQEFLTLEEYSTLVEQYHGITEGNPEDPDDVLCIILAIPLYLMNRYDALISDGNPSHQKWAIDASVKKIHEIETILSAHHVELPDIHKIEKIEVLTIKDDDIWGDEFDGEPLSIILDVASQ